MNGAALPAVAAAVFGGRDAGGLPEHLAEVIAAGKTAGESDLFHAKRGVQKKEDRAGQTDPGKAGKRRLAGFPGEQAGEVGGGQSQAVRKLVHGKPVGKVFLHIMKRSGNRRGGLGKRRGLKRAQKGRKKPVDQLAALIAFQLPPLPDLPVQVQPQKDGKTVLRQRKTGAEGLPDPVKKGKSGLPPEMDIKKFPVRIRPVRRQEIAVLFRNMDEEGPSGGERLRMCF